MIVSTTVLQGFSVVFLVYFKVMITLYSTNFFLWRSKRRHGERKLLQRRCSGSQEGTSRPQTSQSGSNSLSRGEKGEYLLPWSHDAKNTYNTLSSSWGVITHNDFFILLVSSKDRKFHSCGLETASNTLRCVTNSSLNSWRVTDSGEDKLYLAVYLLV